MAVGKYDIILLRQRERERERERERRFAKKRGQRQNFPCPRHEDIWGGGD